MNIVQYIIEVVLLEKDENLIIQDMLYRCSTEGVTPSCSRLDKNIESNIPTAYNNDETFEIALWAEGTTGGDNCFFDDVYVYGVYDPPTPIPTPAPITNNPTPTPTNNLTPTPTQQPSKSPTNSPTDIPTISSTVNCGDSIQQNECKCVPSNIRVYI